MVLKNKTAKAFISSSTQAFSVLYTSYLIRLPQPQNQHTGITTKKMGRAMCPINLRVFYLYNHTPFKLIYFQRLLKN